MKIRLDDRFNLHASISERVLLNVTTAAKYLLDEEQDVCVRLLDGSHTLTELRSQFDDDSIAMFDAFIVRLRDVGAIVEADDGGMRIFPVAPVQDIRLNAVHLEAFG